MSRTGIDVIDAIRTFSRIAHGSHLLCVGIAAPGKQATLVYGNLIFDTGVVPPQHKEQFGGRLPNEIVAQKRPLTVAQTLETLKGVTSGTLSGFLLPGKPEGLQFDRMYLHHDRFAGFPMFQCSLDNMAELEPDAPYEMRVRLEEQLKVLNLGGWKGLIQHVTGFANFHFEQARWPVLNVLVPVPMSLEYPKASTDTTDRIAVRALSAARAYSYATIGTSPDGTGERQQLVTELSLTDDSWSWDAADIGVLRLPPVPAGNVVEVVLSWEGPLLIEQVNANGREPLLAQDLYDLPRGSLPSPRRSCPRQTRALLRVCATYFPRPLSHMSRR